MKHLLYRLTAFALAGLLLLGAFTAYAAPVQLPDPACRLGTTPLAMLAGGGKTLVDALKPCADALTAAAEAGDKLLAGMAKGAKAAHEGAEATKTHKATLGRAGTVGERSIGFPDAGAHGLDVIFNELVAYIAKM